MDFTREPIVETIITPKDGCKIVVRSSKSVGQEEYFVDAVEVVAFGSALFFRSQERPKPFLVPVGDYEILEVREARMVLKSASPERSIKIGGGREAPRPVKELEKVELPEEVLSTLEQPVSEIASEAPEGRSELRFDKKRDRRRNYRKKRGGKDEPIKEEFAEAMESSLEEEKKILEPKEALINPQTAPISANVFSSLLQPPPTLISDTIGRYRENAMFKNAFFLNDEDQYKPHDKVEELLNEEEFVNQIKRSTHSLEEKSENEVPLEMRQEGIIPSPEEFLKEEENCDEGEEDLSLPLFSEDFNGLHGEEDLPFQDTLPNESNKKETHSDNVDL